jgi:PleD family two-component response regulator
MLGLLHLQRLKMISNSGAHADPSLALAVATAEDLCLALANMMLRESLREQSIRNPLTGLFNRRFVDEYLMQELARAQRMKRQISMVALDIDHFKRINDTFGHSAADALFRAANEALYRAKNAGRNQVVSAPPPA